jgi:hypothetical protein
LVTKTNLLKKIYSNDHAKSSNCRKSRELSASLPARQLIAEDAFKMKLCLKPNPLAKLRIAVILTYRFMYLIIFAFKGKIAGSFKLKAIRLMPVYTAIALSTGMV